MRSRAKPNAHGYSASAGIPGMRKAQANYYARRFGVELDPATEVVMTMGSKEGLASLADRDHRAGRRRDGTQPQLPDPHLRLHHRRCDNPIGADDARRDAIGDALDRAMAFTVPRPSILIVNYPSNPTAETVDLAFYERLVAWAKENKVWVLSDLAYSELYYDGNPTPSILQVPGAKDIAVEFTSMTRPTRWPDGASASPSAMPELIAALKRVKSYLDYGAFTPIQAAACAALNGPQDIVEKNRELYQKRRDVLVESFGRGRAGNSRAPRPRCSPGRPCRRALKDMGSLEFSKQLLTHAEVAVAPGVGYGEDGEGFVRIAMVENEQRLRQAARNIKRYLASMGVNTTAA